MLTGTLRSAGINVAEYRVAQAMIIADPENHLLRVQDGQKRFNPVPYNAKYFGHKLHVDLNEKLVDYNCLIIGCIDGYCGFLLEIICIHRKNCLDVYDMYRYIKK